MKDREGFIYEVPVKEEMRVLLCFVKMVDDDRQPLIIKLPPLELPLTQYLDLNDAKKALRICSRSTSNSRECMVAIADSLF